MNGMRRRVTRRRVAASSSGTASPTEALHLAVTEAVDEVVVHHADGLHECVADGRSHEAVVPLDECRAHRVRLPGAGGEIAQRAPAKLFRLPADEAPEKGAERAVRFLELEECAGIPDRGIHFLAIAYDSGVLQDLRDFLAVESDHALGVEPVEYFQEAGALVQDDAPGESGLEAVEYELREQLPLAPQGHAPLLVVVGEHQGIVGARPAAFDHGPAIGRVRWDGYRADR